MTITLQKREIMGTSAANDLRQKGMIPAEIYGHGFQNIHAAVPVKEFTKVLKEAGETTVVHALVGNETMPVLIYDIDRDPMTDAVRHIDLYRVRMDEKITAKVPVEFTGESPAVKAGGVLVKAVQEIEVEALPADMPRVFAADIGMLAKIGQSVYLKDLNIEKAVREKIVIALDPETVLATVIAPRAEEVASAPAPTMEDVKVEIEEKKIEREKEKESEDVV